MHFKAVPKIQQNVKKNIKKTSKSQKFSKSHFFCLKYPKKKKRKKISAKNSTLFLHFRTKRFEQRSQF